MKILSSYKFIVVMHVFYFYIIVLYHCNCKINHLFPQSVNLAFLSVLPIYSFACEAVILHQKQIRQ